MLRRSWARGLAGLLPALLAGPLFRVAAQEPVVDVAIEQYLFQPARLSIKSGTTVRWTNREKRTTHTVLFGSSGGMESDRLFPGDSWQRRFDQPGSYAYTCGPHPEMRGWIDVTP